MVDIRVGLPDDVHRRLKLRAAGEGMTLKALIIQLLGDRSEVWGPLVSEFEACGVIHQGSLVRFTGAHSKDKRVSECLPEEADRAIGIAAINPGADRAAYYRDGDMVWVVKGPKLRLVEGGGVEPWAEWYVRTHLKEPESAAEVTENE